MSKISKMFIYQIFFAILSVIYNVNKIALKFQEFEEFQDRSVLMASGRKEILVKGKYSAVSP
jgi:hypothetical protein